MVCPKCGAPLVEATTKTGKKIKKCSTNTWDPATRTASGCDYVEWPKATAQELDEDCPTCGAKLILMTTATGKQLKKCSTSKWNRETRSSEGCPYVQWM
jgi:ssDNA-binding Zn-finger/Zn-ribbon topoisomerase 1